LYNPEFFKYLSCYRFNIKSLMRNFSSMLWKMALAIFQSRATLRLLSLVSWW